MKIVLVLNDDFSMYIFRGGLIRTLLKKGFQVVVIVPPGKFNSKLEELGAQCIAVPIERFISPVKDILYMIRLFRIFRSEQFDIVHNMTIKPNIYGTFAARIAGIKRRVCLISGSGFMFLGNPIGKERILRTFVVWMYRFAMNFTHKVWFQNPDDLDDFVNRGILPQGRGIVIRSGGINLSEYSPGIADKEKMDALKEELGMFYSSNCVLMVAARMIWSKGVREFVEAAFMIHDKFPDWYFVMLTPREEDSPDSVPERYFESNKIDRLIVIDKFRYDIKDFIAVCDIMVLPSYYREGVPRTLLEGLAMAKPIITTDHPGCRETVDEGENGYLVPIKNTEILADRIDRLMSDEELRSRFGRHSRRKAEREFSEQIVVSRIISEVYGLNI